MPNLKYQIPDFGGGGWAMSDQLSKLSKQSCVGMGSVEASGPWIDNNLADARHYILAWHSATSGIRLYTCIETNPLKWVML